MVELFYFCFFSDTAGVLLMYVLASSTSVLTGFPECFN